MFYEYFVSGVKPDLRMLLVGFIVALVSGTSLSFFLLTALFSELPFYMSFKELSANTQRKYRKTQIILHVKGISLTDTQTIAAKAPHKRAQLAILVLLRVFIAGGPTPL